MSEEVTGQGGVVDAAPGATETAAPAGGEEQPFYSAFEDAQLKDWAIGKGWKNAEAVVKSAQHLEKMVGVPSDQIVRIPKAGDVDGWNTFHAKMGRPQAAEAYEIPGLQDDDASQAYGKHMREAFHKAGLNQDQVSAIMTAGDEFLSGQQADAEKEYELEIASQTEALKKEWGNGYDKQTAVARNAAQRLGFTEEAIDGLERGIGFAETMKLMATLGERMGEDRYVSGESAGGSTSAFTPQQAQQAWAEFKADTNMMAALNDRKHPAHAAALARKSDIFAVMYPTNNQQLS